jgi:acetyltransferase-like isoleucine patch superfamily enzyme
LLRTLLAELRAFAEGLLGLLPGRSGRLARRLYYRKRFAACGRRVSLGEFAEVACPENISIGERVYIDRGVVLRACGGGSITIGDDVTVNGNVRIIADGGRIRIGSSVMIGPNVVIRPTDHAFSRSDLPIKAQGNTVGDIDVGSDVWIAANVVVLRNARIGDHCVIGAGSVVTGEIPAWALAAGVPARVLRYRDRDAAPEAELTSGAP